MERSGQSMGSNVIELWAAQVWGHRRTEYLGVTECVDWKEAPLYVQNINHATKITGGHSPTWSWTWASTSNTCFHHIFYFCSIFILLFHDAAFQAPPPLPTTEEIQRRSFFAPCLFLWLICRKSMPIFVNIRIRYIWRFYPYRTVDHDSTHSITNRITSMNGNDKLHTNSWFTYINPGGFAWYDSYLNFDYNAKRTKRCQWYQGGETPNGNKMCWGKSGQRFCPIFFCGVLRICPTFFQKKWVEKISAQKNQMPQPSPIIWHSSIHSYTQPHKLTITIWHTHTVFNRLIIKTFICPTQGSQKDDENSPTNSNHASLTSTKVFPHNAQRGRGSVWSVEQLMALLAQYGIRLLLYLRHRPYSLSGKTDVFRARE